MPPIYQTSTYAQSEPGKPLGGFEYSRSHNPTRRMLEDCLALLEGGTYGLATSSGMSAISLVLSLFKQGDEVICCDDVYGGTYRLFTKIMPQTGMSFKFADLTQASKDPSSLESLGTANTKLVWLETPTNPLLKLIDIKAVAQICKKKGWLLVVDNTFMSPIFQQPLELGADIVVHSMTKYIAGHSDVVAGALVCRDPKLAERLYFNQNSMGPICSPFDSWLVLRSLKTLPVRMRAHQENALKLALWMSEHPKIEKVIYPGLSSHPQHELAKRQMKGFGGMMSAYIKGGLKEAEKLLKKVKVFTLAESLGGVESLVEHPGIMTHASLPAEIRTANGIGDNFVRFSIGLESLDDIKADLDNALS
jgi:cystathionine gamma-lyase